ncbi:MAG: acetylornithine deacetylase/Succinyl-diaminopimelate desuccinylase [Microbacterium sp.]|nr:acetylornithine deacetylase/Succinyl-diaminopimelate desuccinylase [Microbacterium sp.]
MTSETPRNTAIRDAVATGIPTALADLGSLVRIPSIAWPSFDQSALQRSAEAVAALAESTGVFERVEVTRSRIPGTDESTGDEALWETPPFEPTVRDGRLYGRGAADDKAGVMVHIAALRALREIAGDDLSLGLALFVEGEEEYGSRSFGQFLVDNADALRSDVIVVADSGNLDDRTPALTVSLRGNARFTLTVRTLEHASHSGMFGGAVPDAFMATIKLLSTRIWNKPAITVIGIDATSVEAASNTLAPEISVVVSARVAPGQRAEEAYAALEAHLRAHAPFGAELSFSDGEGYGVDAIDAGIGGSIPFIADLVEQFPGAQILVTGVEDPHTRAHSPNESLHLETFRNAVLSEALLLERIDARTT